MYTKKSVKKYVQDLGAAQAVPGGGSAAALSGALGTALLCMVIAFTVGKARYARYEKRLKSLSVVLRKIRHQLCAYTDEDCAAFASSDMRRCLEVPRATARLCLRALKLCPEVAAAGNRGLISDVGVAAVLLEAACSAACYTIGINLSSVKSVARRAKIRSEIRQVRRTAFSLRRKTEVKVGRVIAG